MRVLVTGASGMLGANLCLGLLRERCEVRAFVRRPLDHPLLAGQPIDVRIGELSDLRALTTAMEGCYGVYHTAGMISYRPADRHLLHVANVEGTRNVLHAAAAARVTRLVHTSSTAAIGFGSSNGEPLDERADFDTTFRREAYMWTKRQAEDLAMEFQALEVVVVNPCTIFGAGDVHMNTGALFRSIKSGSARLCPPGGTAIVSVSDCVDGHMLAMAKGRPKRRYILASGNFLYSDVFGRIAAAVNRQAPKSIVPAAMFIVAYGSAWLAEPLCYVSRHAKISRTMVTIAFAKRYFSSDRAQTELGWTPKQSLDDAISQAVGFYEKWGLL